MSTITGLRVRDLRQDDLEEVVRIDALHTGESKEAYWRGVLRDFLDSKGERARVGLAAEDGGRLLGYLFGEVRAFEFGSEPCGWIFAVGVNPGRLRGGIAAGLLDEARRRFRAAAVGRVRTMVRRNDVPVLSLFRSSGFVGGSFVQLELDLEDEP